MQIVNAPMVTNKFLHLKELNISIRGWSSNPEYDFLSLASFLDASPFLEIFALFVSTYSSCKAHFNNRGGIINSEENLFFQLSVACKYDLIVGDPSSLRQMPGHRHDKLKTVKIVGFCPQKSLVELTRHILESSTSLIFLILDTILVHHRCSGDISGRKCSVLNRAYISEAYKSIEAVKLYIEEKVPPTVLLDVLEPCKRCHAM
jgi:hypothetical protein